LQREPRIPCVPTNGNPPDAIPLMLMSKTTKALKKQAATSQLAARRALSPYVTQEMTTLAEAFRAQAAVLKKKRKKKKPNALHRERN
jgi:hypothetical protein